MTNVLAHDRGRIEGNISEQEAIINAELPRIRRARDLAIKASKNTSFARQQTLAERQRVEVALSRTVAVRWQAENLKVLTRSCQCNNEKRPTV